MEAQLIDKQAVNATFKVTVPAGEVDDAFDRVVRTLARQVRVPGFRPGRAPRGVLVRRIGLETLAEEVQEALVNANYATAIEELELTPVHAHFQADPPQEGQAFTFEVHAELYPEVALPELSGIVLEAAPRELTDEMVRDAVQQLRNQHATLVPVERPVEGTDYVLLGSLPAANGAAPDAGSEPQGAGSVQPVDMEVAAEEVRAQLMGTRIGEIIELTLTDDARAAGDGAEPAKRTLRVIVKDIKGKDKPEPGDDFAKTLGFDTWDEAYQQLRSSLRSQLEREAFDAQREELLDKLVEGSDIEVPASLIQRRQRTLVQELAQDLRQQGTTMERYLKDLEERQARQEFEQELERAALRGVRRDLVLERLREQRGSEVTDAEFEDAVRYLARRNKQEPGRFKREAGDRWLANYRSLLARDKALRETVRELAGAAAEEDPDAAHAAYESVAKGVADDADSDDEAGLAAGGAPEREPSA